MWKTILTILKEAPKYLGAIITLWEQARRLFPKKKGTVMPEEKTAVEIFLRTLISFAKKVQGLNAMEIVLHIGELVFPFNAAMTEFKGKTHDEVKTIISNTLDNIIGTEPDAIVGPSETALFQLRIPIPVVGDEAFEQLSDILNGIIADRLARAIVK